jgi:hypothetical protein
MKSAAPFILVAALGCGAVAADAANQPAPAAKSAKPVATSKAGPTVEPAAVQALVKMSAYLRTIPAFEINMQTQRDDVDVYGQTITLSGKATYRVHRPNVFAIDLALPSKTRRYVDDGKTVTVFDPKTGYYAKFQAGPTIRDTLQMAADKYGATLPLQDLFTWTEGDARAKALTSAHYIGKTQIGNQTANQYAFRQAGIDWQIWIADGAKPAPLRVALVATKDPARPKFEADLAWNTAPQFAPNTFVFTPPANAKPIDIHPVS